uniref:Uncharacterized protein n=1 Tax=Proboscia inermis TaxID=420281 RepID=A0A7S0C0U7_9STRA|mmetsp:Transcript_20602/g.20885  ORF Transcript_20602/g.20885 Transcript_20602/m.20885 type:complete len:199 (+) Transcript_20602:384-980(+)
MSTANTPTLNANNVKFLKKHVLKLDETTNGDSNYQNIGGNGHGTSGLGGSKVNGLLTKRRMDHQQIKWDHKVHQWYEIKGNEKVEGDEQQQPKEDFNGNHGHHTQARDKGHNRKHTMPSVKQPFNDSHSVSTSISGHNNNHSSNTRRKPNNTSDNLENKSVVQASFSDSVVALYVKSLLLFSNASSLSSSLKKLLFAG